MHTLLILYPPQPDPEAFVRYYEETHLELVRKIPGLESFSYGVNLASPAGSSPFFCVFQADFASAEAMGAALASPEGQATAADVPNFASGEPIILNYARKVG